MSEEAVWQYLGDLAQLRRREALRKGDLKAATFAAFARDYARREQRRVRSAVRR